MKNSFVRIKSIVINNFKNVEKGYLSFDNSRKEYNASILGLYGQNGSGKTALIDALQLLKYALCKQQIPEIFTDYINVNAEYSKLKYEFTVINKAKNCKYNVFYEFKISKILNEEDGLTQNVYNFEKKYKIHIYDEVITYSLENDAEKTKLSTLIDTNSNSVFKPQAKYETLVGKSKEILMDLMIAKQLTKMTSRSFAFSKELIEAIENNCKDENIKYLINSLTFFGFSGLFIINTTSSGLISMNALPISFKYEEDDGGALGMCTIPLEGVAPIPLEMFEIVQRVIKSMNIVLPQIIPGLTISVVDLGTEILNGEKVGKRIQLLSHKNNKAIPLQYESEGIKKIISILQLLIVVFNNSSITVAIDELDSGIFEYLLGELLRIISENGKGQLIFTSHNLRPLETLDRGFVAFTSINPSNRYIRLKDVKSNNNLRDFYYRDIILGLQNESVYETTNNSEITLAFIEAGEDNG